MPVFTGHGSSPVVAAPTCRISGISQLCQPVVGWCEDEPCGLDRRMPWVDGLLRSPLPEVQHSRLVSTVVSVV